MSDHKPLVPSKPCRDCGVTKPLEDFWANKLSPDGHALYCKPCFTIRNAASAERRAKKQGRVVRKQKSRVVDTPEGMKFCPRCEQVLPLDDFVRNRSTKTGIGSYCRPCQNNAASESIKRLHGSTRHYHLTQRYGMGAAEVETMLDGQAWRCLICWIALTAKTAHVDHDHATGRVRGILCFNCNGGLGQFQDNARLLRSAAAYLDARVERSPIELAWVMTMPHRAAS